MSAYLITYFISDTCGCGCSHDNHEHNHQEPSEGKIIAKIKSLGSWGHVMPEAYVIKTDLSSAEILNELKSVSNVGDLLFISQLDKDNTECSNPAVTEWIKKL